MLVTCMGFELVDSVGAGHGEAGDASWQLAIRFGSLTQAALTGRYMRHRSFCDLLEPFRQKSCVISVLIVLVTPGPLGRRFPGGAVGMGWLCWCPGRVWGQMGRTRSLSQWVGWARSDVHP